MPYGAENRIYSYVTPTLPRIAATQKNGCKNPVYHRKKQKKNAKPHSQLEGRWFKSSLLSTAKQR